MEQWSSLSLPASWVLEKGSALGSHRHLENHVNGSSTAAERRAVGRSMPSSGRLREVRITESLRLEKTSKIIRSNRQPNTTLPAQPCPEVPHPQVQGSSCAPQDVATSFGAQNLQPSCWCCFWSAGFKQGKEKKKNPHKETNPQSVHPFEACLKSKWEPAA